MAKLLKKKDLKGDLLKASELAKDFSSIWFPGSANPGPVARCVRFVLRVMASYDTYDRWVNEGGVDSLIENSPYSYDVSYETDPIVFNHFFPKSVVIKTWGKTQVREVSEEGCHILMTTAVENPTAKTTITHMGGLWKEAIINLLWEQNPDGIKIHCGDMTESNFCSKYIPSTSTLIRSPGELDDLSLVMRKAGKILDAGLPRRILLWGPPGTGKSETAYQIIKDFSKKKVCVIDASTTSLRSNFLTTLAPDALLLDDFDRLNCQSLFFDYLTDLKGPKLVIATVNSIGSMPAAILRAGRFDDIVAIRSPVGAHLEAVISHYENHFNYQIPLEHRDALRGLPPAFIRELIQSLSILGDDFVGHELSRVKDHIKVSYESDLSEES